MEVLGWTTAQYDAWAWTRLLLVLDADDELTAPPLYVPEAWVIEEAVRDGQGASRTTPTRSFPPPEHSRRSRGAHVASLSTWRTSRSPCDVLHSPPTEVTYSVRATG
jgi:hypothetical protein